MRMLLIALLSLICVSTARAEFPYPSNPNPCNGEAVPPDCIPATDWSRFLFLPTTNPPSRPNDFGDNWKLTSDTTGEPEIDNNPQELFGVKGASADLAWQVTTGRPDVVIAVLDSGIRWGERQDDLVNKFYLNRAELPAPEGSSNPVDPHDRNGDGVFNVRDYLASGGFAQDSRVSDQNGTGAIDPEDLIFLFSDGVDDDANGYVDDISGWDFFEDDNDPLDEPRYGHGTGESHDSAGEANNGREGVGTCPNCMLLEVRVGDSFVTAVDKFAHGVLFAVDSGARIVQEALGTLNNSHFAQQAVDYAYSRGVIVMASAADEESAHNNWPASYSHTFEINSVVKFFDEGGIVQTPHSYLYLNGCTNYNGHIAVSVPSSACSSEATGLSSGYAGLVYSAALNAIDQGALQPYPGSDGRYPLSAEEVKQIFTRTADDINFDAWESPMLPQNYFTDVPVPGVQQTSSRYPSIEGFDQYFGYGRINANAAVRRVLSGQIPPEASISTPLWHAYLPLDLGSVAIEGRVAAVRAQTYRYTVEVAAGVQQPDSAFVTIFQSAELSDPVEGVLAELDLNQAAALLPHGAAGAPVLDDSNRGDPDRFAITVRVRVTDDGGQLGEDRRTLHLHDDPQLANGFPLQLTSDGGSPPMAADLDNDGIEELVIAGSNGILHAFHLDGTELPGWPVTTRLLEIHTDSTAFASGAVPPPHIGILADIAIGDLDRDGSLEVVAADLEGYVYVWNKDGQLQPGFPVSTLKEYSNARRSERDLSTEEGRIPDKTNRKNRDNRLHRGFGAGPALGNLDGSADGSLEIIVGALDRHIYAWDRQGQPVPGWPLLLKDPSKVESIDPVTNEVTLKANANALDGTKVLRSVSLGDTDGDDHLDVIAVVNEQYDERPNATFDNVTLNFLIAGGLLDPGNTRVYALYSDGALHGDSGVERGWNPAAFQPGWPVKTALLTTEILPVVGSGSNGAPALADLDNDGLDEIVTFSVIGPVYVFNGDGSSMLGVDSRRQPIVLAQEPFGPGSNSADNPTFGCFGGPAVAELRGPGSGFNVVAPTIGFGKSIDTAIPAKQMPADNLITAWNLDRTILPGFPRQVNDLQFFVVPVVADVSGDDLPEILQGSGVRDLHGVDADGIEPEGWPKFTAGWSVAPPAVLDLDGDGKMEVAHVTREGWLFVWHSDGDACGYHPWRHARHDSWGTSNAGTDARPPATIHQHQLVSSAPGEAVLHVTPLPADDLRCGDRATLDVRFSPEPIVDEASFAAASRVSTVQVAEIEGGSGAVTLRDRRLLNRSLYFAVVARDDAGNRSLRTDLGTISFPDGPLPATCTGDCDGSGDVTVDELITGVSIALGTAALESCPAFDLVDDGAVTVDEILTAVNAALIGCQ